MYIESIRERERERDRRLQKKKEKKGHAGEKMES